MLKRNIIAHSDSLLTMEDIVDLDFEWTHEGSIMYPLYGTTEPFLTTIANGEVNYENLANAVEDFSKYFSIASDGLKEIDSKLFAVIIKEENC